MSRATDAGPGTTADEIQSAINLLTIHAGAIRSAESLAA